MCELMNNGTYYYFEVVCLNIYYNFYNMQVYIPIILYCLKSKTAVLINLISII